MPKYKYSAVDENGRIVRGKVVAVSKAQAKEFVKTNGLTVTGIALLKEVNWAKMIQGDSVPVNEVILFSRLLAGAIKNGMTLKEAMEVLYRQVSNPTMKEVIMTILSDLKAGVDMSVSIEHFPKVFPAYYAPLIKAGEEIGDLPGVLEQITEYAEKLEDIKKEVKSIVTYPLVILTMGLLLVVVILTKIMPSFKKTFTEMGANLPLPTVVLMAISDAVVNNWPILLGGGGSIVLVLVVFFRTRKGKYALARLSLQAPLIGSIIQAMTVVNFLKTLATLLKNGVPINQSLSIVQNSIRNLIVKDIIRDMKKNVLRGMSLAAPLHQNEDIFPPTVAYAVDMGEKSGNLGEVLQKSAEFYDKQSVYELKLLGGKISPIMTLLIGGLVLWVAMAIYLPMFDMMSTAGK